MEIIIEKMKETDWLEVASIYLEGINSGNATFQTEVASWNEWDKNHCKNCRIVMKSDTKVIGWASISKISQREVYSGVGEVSIYFASKYRGKGLGKELLEALISRSEQYGYWTLQSGIFPENKASLALHKKCGFRELGVRKNLGRSVSGEWRSVVFLERRSEKVGVD